MAAAELVAGWWAWTVAATLQASVLLGAAWILDRVCVRRLWPELLALAWALALARFFLPPDLSSPLSVTGALGAPTLAAASFVPRASVLAALALLWLAGALALVLLRALHRRRLRRAIAPLAPSPQWRRALERAARRLGVRTTPALGTLDGLSSAAVHGLFAPVVLVPRAWLARAPCIRDEHALLHELAHVARRDLWRDELVALVRALLWFHPLAWIAAERLHALAELACDQAVARALGREAPSYRETLVLAARPLVRPAAGVRSLIGSQSALVVRIERLERAATRPLALIRGANAALAVALAACVLPMAPRAADLRARALAVFAGERAGRPQSCFHLRAAALVLAADPEAIPPPHED